MKNKIAEDLGRLYEVGFNLGILNSIKHHKITTKYGDLYRQDLQQLKFYKIQRRIVDKVISPQQRQLAEKWSQFFIQKGFLSGLNFFREYLKSTGWDKSYKLRKLEILYYQCRFNGENSIGTYEVKSDCEWFNNVLSQFDHLEQNQINQAIDKYSGTGSKGEFLNADTLLLLGYRQREYKILCVDLSVFSIKTPEDIQDVDYIEILRALLKREMNYIRSKSVFDNLRIDTDSVGIKFSEYLKSYFTAFKYQDKESTKLIQAAGYTYSFYQFLQETGLITPESSVNFNAVGYSDRGISSLSVSPENLDVLKTCYQIYKFDQSPQTIKNARQLVLSQIKRNARHSFENGKELIEKLSNIQLNKVDSVFHQEKITGFLNTVAQLPLELTQQLELSQNLNLRDSHAELIQKALISEISYLFLTGNPGIGKTTAITQFLKEHLDDGFLIVYISPRTQVNLDIINKFKQDGTESLCDDRILAINTNRNLIKDYGILSQYTVQYHWNQRQGDFREKTVQFIENRSKKPKEKHSERLTQPKEDVIQDRGSNSKGVLNSLCEAIYTVVDRELSNNIVATVAIQSLRKTEVGDTLKHFEKIFRNAYIERDNKVIADEMQKISRRIKHLFIMIDEITGDDGGVEFLQGMSNLLYQKYKLNDPAYGFNTKIIVADASIVDQAVITQHLSNSTPEPDKIYFRRASNISQPLSIQNFKFNGLNATAINANSYPASDFSIKYNILIESCPFNENANLKIESKLVKNIQEKILEEIETLLEKSDVQQVLVYIQNKRRLSELIETIKKHRGQFQKLKDYLEIHASLSETEKQDISQYKNDVKVVFMTASASRGLSFPKAKHILVEIPRFEIEKNLMEVIQVIYRGRGDETIDHQAKQLIFYLGDRCVYSQEDPQLSLQESVLSLLNILLILKASIMTRIMGSGKMGRDQFMIIPIGGKSVLTAGETFSTQIVNLIKQLKAEHYRNRRDYRLQQVYESIEEIMGDADIVLRKNLKSNEAAIISYLELQKSFDHLFSEKINHSLENLLDFDKIEAGHISGGLLIVPIADKILEENYEISVMKIEKFAQGQLFKNMKLIRHSSNYPDSLKSAIQDVIELVKKLQDPNNKTQRFQQRSQRFDQYYALPLLAFIAGDVFQDYFSLNSEELQEQKFKEILTTYIRSLYPVNNTLPIGSQYADFPFVVFRSYSLEHIREKMFNTQYLLTSHELNILNLILSTDRSR